MLKDRSSLDVSPFRDGEMQAKPAAMPLTNKDLAVDDFYDDRVNVVTPLVSFCEHTDTGLHFRPFIVVPFAESSTGVKPFFFPDSHRVDHVKVASGYVRLNFVLACPGKRLEGIDCSHCWFSF
ncbi:hypothetical protein D3C71_1803940 [compost metagenome]